MRFSVVGLVLVLLGIAQALSSSGSRLLVVLEEDAEKTLYSQLWADLESRGYELSFESPKNEDLALFKHGETAYDHILLTPPKSKGYGPALTPKLLLDFTNAGGNILLGLSAESGTSSGVTSLLLEFDIHLSADRTAVVIDHFNYDATSAPEKHDVLLLPRPTALRPDVKDFFGGDGTLAVPRAVGHALGNASPLLLPVLIAPETAYTYNPKQEDETVEDPFATGGQLALVSTMQARNSARFTVLGSLEMLQDKWFDASVKVVKGKSVKTANKAFATQLTEWTFKEVGVLKVGQVNHFEVTDSSSAADNSTQVGLLNPQIYRIKNHVTFTIELSEYSHTQYIPFEPPGSDSVQLEFTMLSPFQRLALQALYKTPTSTIFGASFPIPDQHGIFAFRVNYRRPFFTPVDERHQVTVRHFAHDEWPRSWAITGAWVWIAGLWTVVAGFVAFVGLWLYCAPVGDETQKKHVRNLSR